MPNRSLRILVVDDNALIMLAVANVLEDAGFIAEGARSGRAAIDLLSAPEGAFDVLITDIDLGDGPDGWSVAQHARQRNPRLPVIFMTGDANADMASTVPGAVLLTKPVPQSQLMTALDRLLFDAVIRSRPLPGLR